jgi:hypothetical protein
MISPQRLSRGRHACLIRRAKTRIGETQTGAGSMTRSRNTEAAFGRFFCLVALPSVLRFRSLFRNPNAGSRAISLPSGCAAWDRFHCFCGAVRARYGPAWTSVRLRQCGGHICVAFGRRFACPRRGSGWCRLHRRRGFGNWRRTGNGWRTGNLWRMTYCVTRGRSLLSQGGR